MRETKRQTGTQTDTQRNSNTWRGKYPHFSFADLTKLLQPLLGENVWPFPYNKGCHYTYT